MWWTVCSLLAWFPLQAQAGLAEPAETLSVEEGRSFELHCEASHAHNTSLQWLAPSGFTIFLNAHSALRSPKYQLLHCSSGQLSIRLLNATQQDEGVYKCLQYGDSVTTTEVRVTVLATPAQPTVAASIQEGYVKLTCSTVRSKPAPQITWRLGDLEIYGETHHEVESDGNKWNSTSTLWVHTHGRNATMTCVVRHPGLQGKTLLAPFRFEDLVTEEAAGTPETSPLPSADSRQPSSPVGVMEGSSTLETDKEQEEQIRRDPDPSTAANPESGGLVRKKSGILLLTLVSFLILVLFIIVQLFIMKLRKAHVVWKKENEISEYTLESYRSRSNNEESSSQEKNGQTSRSKSCVSYITRLYSEARTKRKARVARPSLRSECCPLPESIV